MSINDGVVVPTIYNVIMIIWHPHTLQLRIRVAVRVQPFTLEVRKAYSSLFEYNTTNSVHNCKHQFIVIAIVIVIFFALDGP